jgi:hypothetical protein
MQRATVVSNSIAQQIAVAEAPVPVLREGRVIWYRAVEADTAEPPIRQVKMHILAQAPLRTDPHPDHQLRVDRWTTHFAVIRPKVLADAAKIDEPINRAQQMILRHMTLKAEAVEQRFLHHRPLAHHLPSPAAGKTESDQRDDFNTEFFNMG